MHASLIVSSVCATGVLILASSSFAGQPVTQLLNPSPPGWQTCKAVGDSTICEGTNVGDLQVFIAESLRSLPR